MTDKGKGSNDHNNDELWSIEPYEALVFIDRNGTIVPTRISSEDSIAGNVDYITQFVERVIKSKRPLLSLEPVQVKHSRRPNTRCVSVTRGGKCFLKCLKMDLDRIIDKYPNIGKFNRYFGIFYDAVMHEVEFGSGSTPLATAARFDWLNSRDRSFHSDHALALMVQYCNEAIEKIKREGNSEGFRDWLAEVERQPKANEGRLLSLVDACLSVNHHLLVLRFDLGYGQLYSDRELSGEMAVSYEEMREHRVALRRYLKRYLKGRLPPGACKGMAFSIKLEYGLDKGYHFHVIVILNGDVVGKDAGITEMICHQWKCAITMSKGGACNCNQRLYKRKGIGSIRYWETEKLGILRKVVVPYVTKVDFYGKMVKPDGHRTFWPSYPPKIEAKPRGRKRKNGEAE